jgi:protein TonB
LWKTAADTSFFMDMGVAGLVQTPASEMSAIRQFRILDGEGSSSGNPEAADHATVPARDNPLQMLREAIAQLKCPGGTMPDQEQVASLLAEAREALEHANVVARAMAQCDAGLHEDQFDAAFQALDEGLLAYPDDSILTARRREVKEQQKAFYEETAVRGAIEEAKWLLDHDRADLAAQFLKDKVAELPDQEALTACLAEMQALLPEWQEKRDVHDALGRARTLEQLEQWHAALTVAEEALQAYPANAELGESAKQLKRRVVEYEQRKKLARRIELIREQITARSWRRALALLENTQTEFPGANELKPLRREITVGLRRAECEDTVTEVRKCLVDGELEQAECVLQRGVEALSADPALEAVRKELEAEKRYRDQLRQAQVLFARRQLEEAERVLTGWADQDRPEAHALLDAVRASRAAVDEEHFMEAGRQKALDLVQQQQFAQAADLLRNLLSLFPRNPILERDLAAAQAALESTKPAATPEIAPEPESKLVEESPEPPAAPFSIEVTGVSTPGRLRRLAVASAASLALVSAAGVAWKMTQRPTPARRLAAAPPAPSAVTPAPVVTPPTQQAPPPEVPSATESTVASPPANREPAKATPKTATAPTLRAFVLPQANPAAGKRQSSALPLPPGTDPVISVTTLPALPAGVETSSAAPSPPPPVVTSAPAPTSAPSPAQKAVVPTGGKLQQAVLIRRTLPTYPAVAGQRALAGVVRLSAVIDENGDVGAIKILSGSAVLAGAAKTAVASWKYRPAMLNGRPVSSTTEIQMVFEDRDR